MPNLDDVGEAEKSEEHVSMPSLNAEDEENTQSSQEQTEVPMDLEDLQNAAGEGQQLKFIVDENGQFLQLDNHILTTDSEGNQILVQGTDQEQLQHLLQSVGVDGNQGQMILVQGNGEGMDGEGTTLQMIGGDGNQGQMILVQGEDGESHLVDASMLQTEGGNLVLQQGADGQITVTMAGGEDGQQIFIQQPMEHDEGEGQEHDSGEQFSQIQDEGSQDAEDPLAASQQETEDQSSAENLAENVTSTTEVEPKEEEEHVQTTEAPVETPSEEKSEEKCDDTPTEEKVN